MRATTASQINVEALTRPCPPEGSADTHDHVEEHAKKLREEVRVCVDVPVQLLDLQRHSDTRSELRGHSKRHTNSPWRLHSTALLARWYSGKYYTATSYGTASSHRDAVLLRRAELKVDYVIERRCAL